MEPHTDRSRTPSGSSSSKKSKKKPVKEEVVEEDDEEEEEEGEQTPAADPAADVSESSAATGNPSPTEQSTSKHKDTPTAATEPDKQVRGRVVPALNMREGCTR